MIKVELTLEDTFVTAERTTKSPSWTVTVVDTVTLQRQTHIMSDDEFVAMCALGIHGDGIPLNEEFAQQCYDKCEHFFTSSPNCLRPIP